VRAAFTEQELVTLTMAIVAINGFNRIAVGLGYHELLHRA
jgi:alkylhydroperoxidase family enzyme